MEFTERQLVTVMVDLAQFTQAVAGMNAVEVAAVVNRYYSDVSTVVIERDGKVVKYLGDGCLAVFPAGDVVAAVDAVEALAPLVDSMATEFGLDMAMGANVHLSVVADGEFGPDRRYDVVGAGVIHTFRMGGGRGIRISEPVYRSLPSDRRSVWSKRQPPATYTRA
jgi:adenylate cyclase